MGLPLTVSSEYLIGDHEYKAASGCLNRALDISMLPFFKKVL